MKDGKVFKDETCKEKPIGIYENNIGIEITENANIIIEEIVEQPITWKIFTYNDEDVKNIVSEINEKISKDALIKNLIKIMN